MQNKNRTVFFNYLENRYQRVKSKETETEWKKVKRSVPQGGGFSPELFNTYTRELSDESEVITTQFADDITHSDSDFSFELLTEKLQKAFYTTKKFCDKQKLEINTKKTQFIIFKPPRKKLPENFKIQLEDNSIMVENSVKLLGVQLDKHLTFDEQINSVIKKCNSKLGMLARASKSMPKQLLKLAYTGLVRSHTEFASSLYLGLSKKNSMKLEIIQKSSKNYNSLT